MNETSRFTFWNICSEICYNCFGIFLGERSGIRKCRSNKPVDWCRQQESSSYQWNDCKGIGKHPEIYPASLG